MTLDRIPGAMISAADSHVLSRPRGRCRHVRRRYRAMIAVLVLSTLAVAALGARILLAAETSGF